MSVSAWPPVILPDRVPWWVRMRDLVLTIAAWGLFAWWTQGALLLLWDYLSFPMFELTSHAPPDWETMRATIAPFLAIAALLAAWLYIRGRTRRGILAKQYDADQPAALEPDVHAARWGLTPADVTRLREQRVGTVQFGTDGSIVPGQSFAPPPR
jgi:poly-beta-1,6-N-acetyl-D-glucosamine biosynthesis protein PgaD